MCSMPFTFRRALAVPALIAAFVAPPVLARAGPPYQTDDPEPTAYRHFEIYVFETYDNARGAGMSGHAPSLEVNYGLMPNVQFSVTMPFAAAQPSGSPLHVGYGDTEVALKVRFVQEGDGRPQVSFYPSVELPTASVAAGLGYGLPKVFLPLWAQKTNGSWTYFGGGGVWHNPGIADRDSTAVGIGFTADRGEHHALLASLGRDISGSHSFTAYAAYELYLGPKGLGGLP
jgi:hypothetical protein